MFAVLLGSLTVTWTLVIAQPETGLQTLYSKVSSPTNPKLGVYVITPPANDADPLFGLLTLAILYGSVPPTI